MPAAAADMPPPDLLMAWLGRDAAEERIAALSSVFAPTPNDSKPRVLLRNGLILAVLPGSSGAATHADMEVWLHAIGKMMEAARQGDAARLTRMEADECQRLCAAAGSSLSGALRRLPGTVIEVRAGRDCQAYALICDYRLTPSVEVALPDWIARSADLG